ncbi:MAG TPA: hypothetical protein VG897_18105 [Terriglobales bacterium]|jgi:hypothetical protein|nr:hypothetical protein [Terriglobales bacterium]
MCAFFARVGILGLVCLVLTGCASNELAGIPVEQLTVRFNAELTQHWGEYRLIRTELMQSQFNYQLYADGALIEQGKLPLPREGLSALFIEMGEAAAIPGATTQPAVLENDLDERIYTIHLTYETPDSIQQTQCTGSLSRVAHALQQSPQIFAMHQRIMRKLPQTYWFAHLDQLRAPERSPQDQGTAQAEAR